MAVGCAVCCDFNIHLFDTKKLVGKQRTTEGVLHQSPVASILLIDAQTVENAKDTQQLQQQLRTVTGRSDLQVLGVRKLTAADGTTKGYEVDTR